MANIYCEVCITYDANCADVCTIHHWCKDSERGGEVHYWTRCRVKNWPTVCEIVIWNFMLLVFLNLWRGTKNASNEKVITLRSSLISNIFEI